MASLLSHVDSADKPAKATIVNHLEAAKAMLEATRGTVDGALGVRKTVAQTAAWAAATQVGCSARDVYNLAAGATLVVAPDCPTRSATQRLVPPERWLPPPSESMSPSAWSAAGRTRASHKM